MLHEGQSLGVALSGLSVWALLVGLESEDCGRSTVSVGRAVARFRTVKAVVRGPMSCIFVLSGWEVGLRIEASRLGLSVYSKLCTLQEKCRTIEMN